MKNSSAVILRVSPTVEKLTESSCPKSSSRAITDAIPLRVSISVSSANPIQWKAPGVRNGDILVSNLCAAAWRCT